MTIDVKKIIKERRLELGLTMADVAKFVGVSEATVSRWESGDIENMKRSRIAALSDILKISPIVIMGMSENEYDSKLADLGKQLESIKMTSRIPLLGTIAAGSPILAEENIEDYFNLDSKIKVDFALKIKGNSMLGAGIFPDDIVFIRKQDNLENGEIGAILIEEEATLKKFYKEDNTIILQSENDMYKPMIYTNGNIKILGKLVAVLNIRE